MPKKQNIIYYKYNVYLWYFSKIFVVLMVNGYLIN